MQLKWFENKPTTRFGSLSKKKHLHKHHLKERLRRYTPSDSETASFKENFLNNMENKIILLHSNNQDETIIR